MTTLHRRSRPNGHPLQTDLTLSEVQCPYCGQSITRAEFREIRSRVEAEERARIAKIETDLKARVAQEVTKAQTEAKISTEKAKAEAKAQADKAIKAATSAAEAKIKAMHESIQATIAGRVGAEQEKTSKAVAEAVAAEREKSAVERVRLETALSDLGKKVAARPAHQIGAPAERSLHDQIAALLAETAPLDRVSRVGPGVRGADLIVEVVAENGETAGLIIIELKATTRWNSSYTRVLRDNVIRGDAAFGILSTATMPANCRELAVIDNTIVCAPERVPVLVAILRRIVLDNFTHRLGAQAQDEKAARLYSFILSPACDDMFDKLLRIGRDMTALDAAQAKSNQQTFDKRAALIKGVLDIREQIVAVIANIIGGGQ